MNRIISEAIDEIARLYGETAKVLTGKNNLPKPAIPDVRHLTEDRNQKTPLSFFKLDDIPDIRWEKKRSRFALVGLETLETTFDSPLITPYPVNNKVRAVWARHPGDEPRPVVLILHGLFMPDYAGMDQLPFWLKSHGMDGIILDLPYHMSRTPGHVSSGELGLLPDVPWMLAKVLQCVLDIRSVAQWIERDGVASCLGFFGISMGAYLGLLLSCVAEEFDFGVSLVGVADIRDGFMRFEEMADQVQQYENRMGYPHPFRLDKRVDKLLSPITMNMLMRKDGLFMANGEFDHLVTPEDAQRAADNWGVENFHLYPAGHISLMTATPQLWMDVDAFFARAGNGDFNRA